MNEAVVGNIIMGFVILEGIHMFILCWLISRFTGYPLLFERKKNES
jgi:hypothetical protein